MFEVNQGQECRKSETRGVDELYLKSRKRRGGGGDNCRQVPAKLSGEQIGYLGLCHIEK